MNLKEKLLYLINPTISIDKSTIDYLKAQQKHFDEQKEMSKQWLKQDLSDQDRLNIICITHMIDSIQIRLSVALFMMSDRKIKYRELREIDDDLYSKTLKYNNLIHKYGLD